MTTLDVSCWQTRGVFNERFEMAIERVLAGDESVEAAQVLEGVLLDDYPGDERLDDLLEALALYAPGEATPYIGAETLRTITRAALRDLTGRSTDAG